jgi:hypothetical protein
VNTNEPTGSIRDGEFLDQLSDYYLPPKKLLNGFNLLEGKFTLTKVSYFGKSVRTQRFDRTQ